MAHRLTPRPAFAAGSVLSGLLQRVAAAFSLLGTLLVIATLVVVSVDIVGREAFGHPLRGAAELVSLGIVVIVFVSLPHAVASGRMVRVDLLSDRLARWSPRLATGLAASFDLTGAVLMALMAWALAPEVQRAWELDDYVGALGDFTAPLWPVRALQCASAAVTALVFVMLALRRLGPLRPLLRPRVGRRSEPRG